MHHCHGASGSSVQHQQETPAQSCLHWHGPGTGSAVDVAEEPCPSWSSSWEPGWLCPVRTLSGLWLSPPGTRHKGGSVPRGWWICCSRRHGCCWSSISIICYTVTFCTLLCLLLLFFLFPSVRYYFSCYFKFVPTVQSGARHTSYS